MCPFVRPQPAEKKGTILEPESLPFLDVLLSQPAPTGLPVDLAHGVVGRSPTGRGRSGLKGLKTPGHFGGSFT